MKAVSISELKAHLSRYLRMVRRGEEVQVLDRGVPVARLTGLALQEKGEEAEQRERLIAAGVLRAGTGRAGEVLDTPPLELSVGLTEALEEERSEQL